MIVVKNKLALLNFGMFDFYISVANITLFSFFKKYVLSQALSEDAAWDFFIIFKNDFYSIFYHSNFLQ